MLGALGAMVTLVGGALAFVGSRRALAAPTVYIGSGLLLVLVLASLSLGVFGAYAAPGLSIGVPALAAVFDLPAAIVPGPRGRILGVLGAAVLLVLFAATALALRDVINRALRAPDGKGSDATRWASQARPADHANVPRGRVRRELLGRRRLPRAADRARAGGVGHARASSRG